MIVVLLLQCSPAEFYSMVKALVRIQVEMQAYTDLALSDFKAELLQQVFKEVWSMQLNKGLVGLLEPHYEPLPHTGSSAVEGGAGGPRHPQ